MADILIQLKISEELYEQAKKTLARLEKIHNDEVEELEARIGNAGELDQRIKKLMSQWDDLHERGRRLTIHNVVRVAIEDGLESADYKSIMNRVAADGIPLGRPRRGAG